MSASQAAARDIRTRRGSLNTSTVQWACGGFVIVLGALMLVTPQHFMGASYTALIPLLPVLGGGLVLSGLVLVGAAILRPPRVLSLGAHVLAAGVIYAVAWAHAASGLWSGALIAAILGTGVMLVPLLESRPDDPAPDGRPIGDLFGILLGIAEFFVGLSMLVMPSAFDAPLYDRIRPYLGALGVLCLVSGVLLAAVQIWRPRSRWVFWGAHALAACALMSFFFGVALPSRSGLSILYNATFAPLTLVLPWLGPRLRRLNGRSLRVRLAFALAAAVALPLLIIAPLDAALEQTQAAADQPALT